MKMTAYEVEDFIKNIFDEYFQKNHRAVSKYNAMGEASKSIREVHLKLLEKRQYYFDCLSGGETSESIKVEYKRVINDYYYCGIPLNPLSLSEKKRMYGEFVGGDEADEDQRIILKYLEIVVKEIDELMTETYILYLAEYEEKARQREYALNHKRKIQEIVKNAKKHLK